MALPSALNGSVTAVVPRLNLSCCDGPSDCVTVRVLWRSTVTFADTAWALRRAAWSGVVMETTVAACAGAHASRSAPIAHARVPRLMQPGEYGYVSPRAPVRARSRARRSPRRAGSSRCCTPCGRAPRDATPGPRRRPRPRRSSVGARSGRSAIRASRLEDHSGTASQWDRAGIADSLTRRLAVRSISRGRSNPANAPWRRNVADPAWTWLCIIDEKTSRHGGGRMPAKVNKTDEEWRRELTPEQ